jgi:hypothetical protein
MPAAMPNSVRAIVPPRPAATESGVGPPDDPGGADPRSKTIESVRRSLPEFASQSLIVQSWEDVLTMARSIAMAVNSVLWARAAPTSAGSTRSCVPEAMNVSHSPLDRWLQRSDYSCSKLD